MPELPKLLRGFKLTQGANFAGFTLQSATGSEIPNPAYKHYDYRIILVFAAPTNGSRNTEALLDALWSELSQTKTIYGIKNPYACKFTGLEITSDIGNTVTISATAISDRE